MSQVNREPLHFWCEFVPLEESTDDNCLAQRYLSSTLTIYYFSLPLEKDETKRLQNMKEHLAIKERSGVRVYG